MVVVTLLSLIVLALMSVFSSTQKAFRSSITQTDVMEGGRAAIDFMAGDLRAIVPSAVNNPNGVHFFVMVTNYAVPPSPLMQPLVGSPNGALRTNVLENFFILGRGNLDGVPMWFGVAYAVSTNASPGGLYSLYRFATNHPVAGVDPSILFTQDLTNFLQNVGRRGSRLMDGVVHLTVRAYDTNGVWMNTNGVGFLTGAALYGETPFRMYNRMVPAAVEVELGVLEDRTLQRAESLSGATIAQSNYLAAAAGKVHVFRQRVAVQSIDPSGY